MHKIKIKEGDRCTYCGCKELLYLTVDHIIPKAAGGSDAKNNQEILCIMCNRLKGAKPKATFVKVMKNFRELKLCGFLTVHAEPKVSINNNSLMGARK